MGQGSRIHSKKQSADMPQVRYAQHRLKCFRLDMLPDKITDSHEKLIDDILAMLKEAVEDEMRKLPHKDRKPTTIHGKQYMPLEGSFLVELVYPEKETVTLLLGMDNLYLEGVHVTDLWFLMKGCTAPLPPSSQKPYGYKIINAGTKSEFKFHTGIFLFSWSGSYLDLAGGMHQEFFFQAAQNAYSELGRAQESVIAKKSEDLQPPVAFFAMFIPECTRFPHVKGWVRCHTAPGALKVVTPPEELKILMRDWRVKSDLLYSEQTSVEVRRCLAIMKRNPAKHSLLKLETALSKYAEPKLPTNALEPKVNNDQEGPINDDMIDEEDGPDNSDDLFARHTGSVVSVACSPTDVSLVLTGGSDDRAFLWKFGPDKFAHELGVATDIGHDEKVCTVAFSSDGKLIACGSMEGKITVWETSTAVLRGTFQGSGFSFEWLKWHPRGDLIITGSKDHDVCLWNAKHLYLLQKFTGHTSAVTCGDFTPNGKLICTGSNDASLIIWHPKTAKIRNSIRGPKYHAYGLTCLSISLDSQFIVSCSEDGSVHIVNIDSGQVIGALGNNTSPLHCVGISADSLVATGHDSVLSIWNTASKEKAKHICTHKGSVTCLVWVGRFIASGCDDGKVRLWDSTSGEISSVLKGHRGKVFSIALTADGKNIISVGIDKLARVFRISAWM